MKRTIVYEQWITHSGDGRSCDECRALHKNIYARGEGPQPPLHWFCRCERRLYDIVTIDDYAPGDPTPPHAPEHRGE